MAVFTIAALKTELTTDPAGIGYAAPRTAGNTAQLANLINTATATNVFRNDIAAKEVVNAITATDFAALTAVKASQLSCLLQTAPIDATLANMRQRFADMFSGATLTALQGMAQRPGTRAEVLWGTGTVVTVDQVQQALGS